MKMTSSQSKEWVMLEYDTPEGVIYVTGKKRVSDALLRSPVVFTGRELSRIRGARDSGLDDAALVDLRKTLVSIKALFPDAQLESVFMRGTARPDGTAAGRQLD